MHYFKYFPKIQYTDIVIHAPIRFAIQKLIETRDYNLWDYVLADGERPDTIAEKYYEDSNLDWLVLLANQIINPYISWPLSEINLQKLIIKKYGSIDLALTTYPEYKDSEGIAIDVLQYNPALSHTRKNAFEYETEINNNKRNIKLIDLKYKDKFKQDLQDLLQKESNQLSYYLQYNPNFKFSL